MAQGTLYVVGTPIGNRDDLTVRAQEILRAVAVIACEDTRVTAKLLQHYAIATPTISCHHHTSPEKIRRIVARIAAGEDVAVVSDAGTPGISDPGNVLVAQAVAAGVSVVPVPGPSAVATIVSVAGCDMQQFCFMGYPPHKKGRQTFFRTVATASVPVIYHDSVHRVVKNLTLLAQMRAGVEVIVGRELTKMHEQILRMSAEDSVAFFTEHPDMVRGEFIIIVLPALRKNRITNGDAVGVAEESNDD